MSTGYPGCEGESEFEKAFRTQAEALQGLSRDCLKRWAGELMPSRFPRPIIIMGWQRFAPCKWASIAFCKTTRQTVSEARIVRQLAKDKKLAPRWATQGSAEDGLRRAVRSDSGGVIGVPARTACLVYNRPLVATAMSVPPARILWPANLDWDLWLGPARQRPYKDRTYDHGVCEVV